MTAQLMDPIAAVGTATFCPGCGSGHTVWVTAAGAQNLLCKTCGTCWNTAARNLAPWHPAPWRDEVVDVATCPGCAFRPICTAAHG